MSLPLTVLGALKQRLLRAVRTQQDRDTPGWDFVGYHQGPASPVLGQGCLREEECRTESHRRT